MMRLIPALLLLLFPSFSLLSRWSRFLAVA
jgi:hypothetical protein